MTGSDGLLELAIGAARGAGQILLEHARGPVTGLETKSSATDPVSDADRASERYLLDVVARERPDDGVLAEEGGAESSSSGYRWVIDPLDGTVNYLYRLPAWCVSVAVEDPEGTIVGVVHNPMLDETFAAQRGAGATLNGASIAVSEQTSLPDALIGTGFSYDAGARAVQGELVSRVLPRTRDVRRFGSAALDLAALACGRLDGFYEAPMEPWDTAAGVLIAAEAGAVISELPPPLPGLSAGVIGANEKLHDILRALLLA